MARAARTRRAAHRSGVARAGAAVALAGALAACGSARDMAMDVMGVPDLPESADVETAPWPRLVDSPAPVATELGVAGNFQSQVARGDEIEADVTADAEALSGQADVLNQSAAGAAALEGDAEALRRRVDALRASQVN